MCLVSVIVDAVPECPLLLLANRDEQRRRPTAAPRIVAEERSATHWLGGRDLRSGGTWLGLNEFGLIVGITNRRRKDPPHGPRSRGLLCRDLLACPSVDAALDEIERQFERFDYDGCNVLLFSRERTVIVEALERRTLVELPRGIHVVGNGGLDDPADGRIARARSELDRLAQRAVTVDDWLAGLETVAGLSATDSRPGVCLSGGDWGTVSSTLVALTDDSADVRYLYAPGPPGATSFDDYSRQARELTSADPDLAG